MKISVDNKLFNLKLDNGIFGIFQMAEIKFKNALVRTPKVRPNSIHFNLFWFDLRLRIHYFFKVQNIESETNASLCQNLRDLCVKRDFEDFPKTSVLFFEPFDL